MSPGEPIAPRLGKLAQGRKCCTRLLRICRKRCHSREPGYGNVIGKAGEECIEFGGSDAVLCGISRSVHLHQELGKVSSGGAMPADELAHRRLALQRVNATHTLTQL